MKIYANKREKTVDDFIGKDLYVKLRIDSCGDSYPYFLYAKVRDKITNKLYRNVYYQLETYDGNITPHLTKYVSLVYPIDALTLEDLKELVRNT